MDVISRIGEWLNDGITAFFNSLLMDIINNLLNKFMLSLTDIYGMANKLLNTPYAQNTITLIQTVAISALILKMVSCGLRDYILWSSGDSRPVDHFLMNGATGVFMIMASPSVCRYTFNIGCALAEDIALTLAFDPSSDLGGLFSVTNISISALWTIIVFLAAAIMFIFILIQGAIRAVELTVLSVAAPLLCFGGIKSEQTKTWFRNVLVLSFSQALQIFLLKGLMVTFVSEGIIAPGSVGVPFIMVGYLWVVYKGPTLLKEWLYSSGVGQAAVGSISSVGRTAMMFGGWRGGGK